MRNIHRLVLAAVATIVLSVGSAAAAPIVLDQSNTNWTAGFGAQNWQQGIVAGVTGDLVEIMFNAQSAGSLDLFINLGAPWQADAPEYIESVNAVVGWNTVTIDTPMFMTAGTMFTMGFANNAGVFFSGTFSGGAGDYAPGNLFVGPGPFDAFDGWDLNFQTYVDVGAQTEPAPVPEPASLLLVGGGLALLARRQLTRRRQ